MYESFLVCQGNSHYLVKAVIIIIFISTMDHFYVKGVALSDEHAKNYHQIPFSCTEHFSGFQLIVLVKLPATSLFWFSLSSVLFPDAVGSCCQGKIYDKHMHTERQ